MLYRKSSNRYNYILMWTMGQIKFYTETSKKGFKLPVAEETPACNLNFLGGGPGVGANAGVPFAALALDWT